ncbi:type II secretion system F family protein [Streptomyces alkaliterrae]|uniref:Type II secretion system F family protein n=1 Tax=Streptomyces alkaliterrae TaxID=2213162 RepID=A0A5P0YLA7_9ACTN|nr:type II secretion system F family protein [Streptomyces alkaliterrae]MBB1258338.1 type II secretion system F family protein [Streptomyces alkaliterrae]MQS00680.1 hypothetical protein [Streptomyces alkaliterrae]
MTLLALLTGMSITGGLVLLVAVAAGYEGPTGGTGPWSRWRARWSRPGAPLTERERRTRTVRRAGAAVVVAVVWLLTEVPVFAFLAGAAVVGVPWLLASGQAAGRRIDQLEALATWTQSLADSLRLGIGLEQAMQGSARSAPPAIAEPIGQLARDLRIGVRPDDALRACAQELDDVLADRVIAALILSTSSAARGRSTGLADGLQNLATSVRDEVSKRREIESDRAKPRTTVRWLTIMVAAVTVGGVVFAKDYTSPYGTLLGQVVFALCVLGFVGTLMWMRSLAQQRPIPRFLEADPRSAVRSAEPRVDTGTSPDPAAGAEVSKR